MKSIINGVLKDNEKIDEWKKKGNIYEVLRVIDGSPLFLKEHLERIKKSTEKVDTHILNIEIYKLINEVDKRINKNIFISFDPINGDRAIFFITGFYPPSDWYDTGIKINTLNIKRKNPNLKVYDIDYKKTIEDYLAKTGVFETLITDDGMINEGSRSNVFFIKGNKILTPSVEAVLPGITREKVFQAAMENNIEIVETQIFIEDLASFDGAFITGTSIDILPVNRIDEIELQTTDSNCFIKLLKAFKKLKEEDLGIINVGKNQIQ